MNPRYGKEIQMIPVDQIAVLNPRLRGKVKFKQIVNSIGNLGLKRPITVALADGKAGDARYLLVYGQGRLESYRIHGQREIPAVVVEGTREDFFLMSLAENFARRKRTALELIDEIASLKERGYTFAEIAKKIDFTETYVRDVFSLLQHGEDRLLQAVLKGQFPIRIAITIARSDDKAVQRALAEAYERNDLRGKNLIRARRLIEDRKLYGKHLGRPARPDGQAAVSPSSILRTYQRETARQKIVIQRAKLTETRLLFVVSALQQLCEDDHFVTLLQAEALDTMPQFLAAKLSERRGAP